ncbi:MAG: GNAT family N-acetyltransferase [Muribaculaceae bacterium]|nr:GNAT family N-acetyltransferase [Muribaculaceae bacterium]
MSRFKVIKYRPEMKETWDAFVKTARNATFLFLRDYMDYHADRFPDCSWMVYKGNKPVALLPANLTADLTLHSHQGLTYGGWILPHGHINAADTLEIFEDAIAIWKAEGITSLDYKPIPYIYTATPSDDAEYALFRLGAVLTEANVSSALPLIHGIDATAHYNKLRRRALAKTAELDYKIYQTDDATEIMGLVEQCLSDRHDTKPVHTSEEMQRLKLHFPENIHFWILEYGGAAQAAVCIYDTGRVAHAQYIASTPQGRSLNLLTPLFTHLITREYAEREYFDFGTSNEDHGLYLNEGLLRQKSSFGATAMLHRRYRLTF